MPDALFSDPRLAAVYDQLATDRRDLDTYKAVVEEFGVRSVLDVGCGTGVFACMLAEDGVAVIGVDPAKASLDVARTKPDADKVCWIHGDITSLPPMRVDMVIMTGNVAQVFLADEQWFAALEGCRRALEPNGFLVFETRDPVAEAWKDWNREMSYRRLEVPGIGGIQLWEDLTNVSLPYVSFRWTFVFDSDGQTLVSDSTLRFRSRHEIEDSLTSCGFTIEDVRDAPDRPGLEFVFIAKRRLSGQ